MWSRFDSAYLVKKPRQWTAAKKAHYLGTSAEFVSDGLELVARRGGQHPFHHLGVGSSGQIGPAERRVRGQDIFHGRRGGEPLARSFERGEEALDPAVAVAVVVGAGPRAELFAVVAHRGHASGMTLGGVAQEAQRVFDRTERQQIAQRFEAGKHAHDFAAILGYVIAMELVELETGG